MKDQIKQAKQSAHVLLEAKAIIFGFAILHFLVMLVYVLRYEQEFPIPSDHWNPVRVIQEPILLLFASFVLFLRKPWSYLLAIVACGRVIYVLGYLGLVAISAAHDKSIFSLYTLEAFWRLTYESQPQYILEVALAAVIIIYSTIKLSRYTFRRCYLHYAMALDKE